MSFNLNRRTVNGSKPLANMLSNHFLNYPTPNNLNYSWSFGSLAGLFFALQLITGIFLAMHYTPHVEWAFASVEHIMTDVSAGYMFRYFHANGASMIFILIYAHIGRNMYYQSYATRPALWNSGIVIFLLMMATAFIGYVLPWGQMSFWGATVITSLVTAVPLVGEDIAYWVWGGFSINNATLTRFFSLHYLLPFLITGIIGLHLVLLHTDGSSDPLTLAATPGKTPFHPYYTFKDTFIFFVAFGLFGALVSYAPNLLGHSDNFLPANPLVTPAHIVPEWYFTPFYAILRACPNKLGGAIGMFAAILILLVIPFYVNGSSPDARMVFAPFAAPHKVAFWVFVGIFFTLMFLGMRAAEAPYVGASKIFTGLYFAYFLLVLPALAWLNRQLLEAQEVPAASIVPTPSPDHKESTRRPRVNSSSVRPARVVGSGGQRGQGLRPANKVFGWDLLIFGLVALSFATPLDPIQGVLRTLHRTAREGYAQFAHAVHNPHFLRRCLPPVARYSTRGEITQLVAFLFQYLWDTYATLCKLLIVISAELLRRLWYLMQPPYELVPWCPKVPAPHRALISALLLTFGFLVLILSALSGVALFLRRRYSHYTVRCSMPIRITLLIFFCALGVQCAVFLWHTPILPLFKVIYASLRACFF